MGGTFSMDGMDLMGEMDEMDSGPWGWRGGQCEGYVDRQTKQLIRPSLAWFFLLVVVFEVLTGCSRKPDGGEGSERAPVSMTRETSLIVNGFFDETDVQNGWTWNEYYDEDIAIGRNGMEGTNAATIKLVKGKFASLRQQVDWVYAYDSVLLECYIKTEDASGTVEVVAECKNDTIRYRHGRQIYGQLSSERIIKEAVGTHDWERYSLEIAIPKETRVFIVHLCYRGENGGTVHFDNVAVYPVSGN